MSNADVFDKVVAIIKPFAKKTAAFDAPTNEMRIIEDLGVNSARLVDIILEFEDAFGILIDDQAVDKVRTLGDAVEMIAGKLAAK